MKWDVLQTVAPEGGPAIRQKALAPKKAPRGAQANQQPRIAENEEDRHLAQGQ